MGYMEGVFRVDPGLPQHSKPVPPDTRSSEVTLFPVNRVMVLELEYWRTQRVRVPWTALSQASGFVPEAPWMRARRIIRGWTLEGVNLALLVNATDAPGGRAFVPEESTSSGGGGAGITGITGITVITLIT